MIGLEVLIGRKEDHHEGTVPSGGAPEASEQTSYAFFPEYCPEYISCVDTTLDVRVVSGLKTGGNDLPGDFDY